MIDLKNRKDISELDDTEILELIHNLERLKLFTHDICSDKEKEFLDSMCTYLRTEITEEGDSDNETEQIYFHPETYLDRD